MQHSSAHGPRGFTLIELMVVVGIVGILVTIAVGYSGTWRRKQDFSATARLVYRMLNITRGEAIKNGRTAATSFAQGTIYAFYDDNNNGVRDAGESLVLTSGAQQTIKPGITITADKEQANAGADIAVAFDFEGLCRDFSGAPLSVTLTLQDADLAYTYAVDTTIAGAIRIVKQE